MLPGLSPDQERDLILSVGTGFRRRKLDPMTVGAYIRKTLDAGASLTNVAERVGLKSTTMLSRFLKLESLDETVQAVVGWGNSGTTIAFTTASQIGRLGRADQRVAAIRTLELSLNNDEVDQAVQYALRSGKSADECISAIVKLRPRKSHRYLFVGSLQDPDLSKRLAQLGEKERSNLLRASLETAFPSLAGTAHYRLTRDHFVINSTVNVAATFGSGDPELLVTRALRSSLELTQA